MISYYLEKHQKSIKDCLDRFCMISSQKVNQAKSNTFFFDNLKANLKQRITQKCGFEIMADLRIYLRILLVLKQVFKNTFNYIVKRVQYRFSIILLATYP